MEHRKAPRSRETVAISWAPDGLRERFFSKVDRRGPNECWQWTAYVSPDGYGFFGIYGIPYPAHRIAYSLLVGEIPPGLDIDHLCRNRACVNPAHMEPVDRRTNLLRGKTIPAKNVTVTICSKGHPMTEANTYRRPITSRLGRNCRECHRLLEQDRRRRRQAAKEVA